MPCDNEPAKESTETIDSNASNYVLVELVEDEEVRNYYSSNLKKKSKRHQVIHEADLVAFSTSTSTYKVQPLLTKQGLYLQSCAAT